MVAFYNAADQELYKKYKFLPQEQYRLGLNLPTDPVTDPVANQGIVNTNYFTNSGGGEETRYDNSFLPELPTFNYVDTVRKYGADSKQAQQMLEKAGGTYPGGFQSNEGGFENYSESAFEETEEENKQSFIANMISRAKQVGSNLPGWARAAATAMGGPFAAAASFLGNAGGKGYEQFDPRGNIKGGVYTIDGVNYANPGQVNEFYDNDPSSPTYGTNRFDRAKPGSFGSYRTLSAYLNRNKDTKKNTKKDTAPEIKTTTPSNNGNKNKGEGKATYSNTATTGGATYSNTATTGAKDGYSYGLKKGGRAGYFFGGRARLQGGGMSQGNEENQAQSAAMGNITSAPGPGDTGGEGGNNPSDNSDIQFRGGNNPPTNVGNPFGYQDNTPPTNVENPFGYQDNIMKTVLGNRYDTDLDEDIDNPKFTMENMFGITSQVPENMQLAKVFNTKEDLIGLGAAEDSYFDNLTPQGKALDTFRKNATSMNQGDFYKGLGAESQLNQLLQNKNKNATENEAFIRNALEQGFLENQEDFINQKPLKKAFAYGGRAMFKNGGLASIL